jgi:hypothetical protein
MKHGKIFTIILAIAVFSANFFSPGKVLNGQPNVDKAAAKVFRAGAAISNITPFLGGGIVGGRLSPTAMHIHDELHARCLALDDGTTKLVFIVVDLAGISREITDQAKKLIFEEAGIPPENVMISATHTHSGTRASGAEGENFLVRRFADVAKIALNNLEPARIGWGSGSVPEHVFVRRWKMKRGSPVPNPFGGQDQVRMNPVRQDANLLEQASRPDPEVSFISVQSTDGRPLALLANYSLHYVGGVPDGHISADYFAVFADRTQELLKADRQGPPFVGIMSNGTSGDVNNLDFTKPAENLPPYAKMRIVADDVAREVFRALPKVRYHEWVPLLAAQEELVLQARKPDRAMIARAEQIIAREDGGSVFTAGDEKAYAKRTLGLLEKPDQVGIQLQAFRIGDLGVAAIPFEVFAETGLEIKAKSPFKSMFTIELANGSNGYLPTPAQHKLGGYETWLGINRVEVEASEKIVAKLLGLFAKME